MLEQGFKILIYSGPLLLQRLHPTLTTRVSIQLQGQQVDPIQLAMQQLVPGPSSVHQLLLEHLLLLIILSLQARHTNTQWYIGTLLTTTQLPLFLQQLLLRVQSAAGRQNRGGPPATGRC